MTSEPSETRMALIKRVASKIIRHFEEANCEATRVDGQHKDGKQACLLRTDAFVTDETVIMFFYVKDVMIILSSTA